MLRTVSWLLLRKESVLVRGSGPDDERVLVPVEGPSDETGVLVPVQVEKGVLVSVRTLSVLHVPPGFVPLSGPAVFLHP